MICEEKVIIMKVMKARFLKVLLKRISKVAFLYLKCFFNLRRTLINNQNVHNPEEAALIGA